MTKEPNNRMNWDSAIPDKQWTVYWDAIKVTRKTGARFLLGGAFGLAPYTGRWRNTKDLDFFVLPSEKDKIVDALTKAGFDDYYDKLGYDRGWIYRAFRDEVIVDIIWQTPNRRNVVDEEWFKRSKSILLRNEPLDVVPAEELLAIKLYVLQRDRCDWPDLINLLYTMAGDLDWDHVISRMQEDEGLLSGLLHVFNWIVPQRARLIPRNIRERFHLAEPEAEAVARPEQERVQLLDSRGWFAAFQPADQPMKL